MTAAETRYSQTEKDALAVKWAKSRFEMYLLHVGASKFKIITSHKLLIPMFNKACTKLLPRIEKWIMEMQDVDYQLVYQPGSRHPLPENERDDTEKTISLTVSNEHGVVMKSTEEATNIDSTFQDVMRMIKQIRTGLK